MSYNYWKREGLNFRRCSAIPTITIDSQTITVVGIMPEGFTGTEHLFAGSLAAARSLRSGRVNDFETGSKGKLDDRGADSS